MGAAKPRTQLWFCLFVLVFLVTGERPSADPRFFSPASTVRAFWSALSSDTPELALECFIGVGHQSADSHLLHLPPMDYIEVRNLTVDTKGTGFAVVRYEIHYRVKGGVEGAFRAADEVARVRGEWRILKPVNTPPRIIRVPVPAPRRAHVAPGPDFASARFAGDTRAFAAAVVDRPGGAC